MSTEVAPGSAFHRLDLLDPAKRRAQDPTPAAADWRWWVGNLGKSLIAVGILMFGFVAYQLWGTGIETARAQNSLEAEFAQLIAEAPPIVTTTVPPATTTTVAEQPVIDVAPTTVPVTTEPAPVPIGLQNNLVVAEGDPLARIEIPAIGVDDIVVAGVGIDDLKKGPGHFPETPLPGQLGNSAMAGHRTTYGQPFHNVDRLNVGDEIITTTPNGRFVYRVTAQQIVAPSDYYVIETTDPEVATLTLTSCHPKWTARQRIVIFSELDLDASSPVGAPIINYGRSAPADATIELPSDPDLPVETDPPATDPAATDPAATIESSTPASTTTEVAATPSTSTPVTATPVAVAGDTEVIADAFGEGWFSDPDANTRVGLWGLLLALIGVAATLISRKFGRNLAGGLIGIVPFLVTLYFFYQTVNRLLPPNL